MWMKEGQYNVLYPNSLSKIQMDHLKDNNLDLSNYFNYKTPPETSTGPCPMQMMSNDLATPGSKSKSLLHQSNPHLQYRDSKESLLNIGYSTTVAGKVDKFSIANLDKPNHMVGSPASSNAYTQSYVSSTFV